MSVQAIEHIRPLRGGAQAQLMRADDGQFYVVKFVNNPQGRRILVNEWIAARLARALALPVPPCALVEVPPALVDASPALVVRASGGIEPCASGLQFGSRLPSPDPHTPIYDYLPETQLDQISNLADFAGMLCFDKWTCNCNGRQIVYCRSAPRQKLRAYMVDQGFCFNGDDWTFPDSPLRGVYCRNQVYGPVTGWLSFEPWLGRIESLSSDAIFAAAAEVPPAWYGGGEDWEALETLLQRLVRRQLHVRELIHAVRVSARAPFENWTADDARQLGATA